MSSVSFNGNSLCEKDCFDLLVTARHAYYNSSANIMTDDDFDFLEEKAKATWPDNRYWSLVGAETLHNKTKLPQRMGGLNQLRTLIEINQWSSGFMNWNSENIIVGEKLDGLSILLVYISGRLTKAFTRGDGEYGRDISHHATVLAQLPQTIGETGNTIIRGEIIIPDSAFDENNLGEKFENPRAYVAGRVNSNSTDSVFSQIGRVIGYDVSIDGQSLDKQKQFELLSEWNFEIPRYCVLKQNQLSVDTLTDILDQYRGSSVYAIDGIVVEINRAEERVDFDSKNAPQFAFKFKINDETNNAVATVKQVLWDVSKHGYLKPRVEIHPVRLKGITITYISGSNASYIRDNNIGPGTEIVVTRSGDVIPYITEVLNPTLADLPDEAVYGSYSWSKKDVDIILNEDTDRAKIKRITDFFSAIDAPHLKEGNITKLFQAGFDTLPKLIKATEADLAAVLGQAMAKKTHAGIVTSLTDIPLWKLVGSSQMLGRGIGRRRMLFLSEAVPDILSVTVADVEAVKGFDTITAELIAEGMVRVRDFLKQIDGYYSLKKIEPVTAVVSSGVNVCFTGVRDTDLEHAILASGGSIASSVTKNVTVLIAKDENSKSSSAEKARKLGIEIISYEQALSRWS